MRRKTKFYIDHIGISSKDFFDKPGFCMGNFYKTPLDRPYVPDRYYSGHYYMSCGSAYLKMAALTPQGDCAYPKKHIEEFYESVPFEPKGQPGIYNVVMNTRDFEVVRRIYCPLLSGLWTRT